MIKVLTKLTLYLSLLLIGFLLGFSINKDYSDSPFKNINDVIKLIENHYVDSINLNTITNEMISSILTDLDPHSSYINSEKFKSIEEDMQGSFSGVGIQFNIINDSIVVVAPISGGPSEKLGIVSGDRIVNVDGENVTNININNEGVIKRLRGKKGTEVNIKIYRRLQEKLLDYNIIRDDIPLLSIDASMMVKKGIGYIKINRFSATTIEEFNLSTKELLSKNMKKLILDLRGNPGGYLGMAIQMSDAILNKGNLIVYTEGRKRNRENIYATQNGLLLNTEIVVLIDEGSASASEIVSGAIQDNDRGLIIGRKSFGKGLVQEQIEMKDGSVIRLTTQRYYTPSGRCIQTPYETEQEEKQDTTKYKTRNGRIVYGGGGITPDIIIKRDSTLNFLQINLIISRGLLNEFCLKESLNLKKTCQYKTEEQFINSNNENVFYHDFRNFILSKDKNLTKKIGEKELKFLKNLIKATIARNIWGDETYFKILNQEDEFVKKALIYLENN